MSDANETIGAVTVHTDRPTPLTLADLHRWVVWQFPRPKGKVLLCSAVHPPIAAHGWLPALSNPREERVYVFAHTGRRFPTPEAAADWVALDDSAVGDDGVLGHDDDAVA